MAREKRDLASREMRYERTAVYLCHMNAQITSFEEMKLISDGTAGLANSFNLFTFDFVTRKIWYSSSLDGVGVDVGTETGRL